MRGPTLDYRNKLAAGPEKAWLGFSDPRALGRLSKGNCRTEGKKRMF